MQFYSLLTKSMCYRGIVFQFGPISETFPPELKIRWIVIFDGGTKLKMEPCTFRSFFFCQKTTSIRLIFVNPIIDFFIHRECFCQKNLTEFFFILANTRGRCIMLILAGAELNTNICVQNADNLITVFPQKRPTGIIVFHGLWLH